MTTADHPLLTTEMLSHFCTAVAENDADVAAGVMAASVFRALSALQTQLHSVTRRKFLWHQSVRLVYTTSGIRGAIWGYAGQFRKRPWRLISTFG